MFQALRTRSRVSPSTVIATVALVFAMAGGAYAAGRYVITSTKQISPKVLKSLQGKAGAAGAKGAAGANGAAGATGPAGPAGPGGAAGGKGETGAKGEPGTKGEKGLQGEKGTTGFTATLPSKATEKGAWALQSNSENAAITSVSFPIPLETALTEANVFFIPPGEEGTVDPSQCPGSVANPEAAEGDFCVYTTGLGGMSPFSSGAIEDPSQGLGHAGTAKSGANLLFTPAAAGTETAYGTWAVTAP
jgi:Collagen triple helix repeat (20 copies)